MRLFGEYIGHWWLLAMLAGGAVGHWKDSIGTGVVVYLAIMFFITGLASTGGHYDLNVLYHGQ